VSSRPSWAPAAPLYEHHTTSLVFSDPPLHTRVRRILMGALNQRAIARMEAGLVTLVDDLLDRLADRAAPDLIEHFAAQIPVEVIGNLLACRTTDRARCATGRWPSCRRWSRRRRRRCWRAGNAAVTDFLPYLRDLIARRRARPGDPESDVLTRLMQGDAEGTAERARADAQLHLPAQRRPRDHHQPDRQRHARAADAPRPARAAGGRRRR
jgi:cytochrome P450